MKMLILLKLVPALSLGQKNGSPLQLLVAVNRQIASLPTQSHKIPGAIEGRSLLSNCRFAELLQLLADSGCLHQHRVYFAHLVLVGVHGFCLLYTSPSPRDRTRSRMPSS